MKNLGDGSAAIHAMPVGTRAFLEGPDGRMTAERAEGEPVLLVGGGVGSAPLRAIIEDIMLDIMYELPDRSGKEMGKWTVTPEVVRKEKNLFDLPPSPLTKPVQLPDRETHSRKKEIA